MNVVEMKLADLIPYENNPRKNKDAVQYVANSIKEFGFKVPIIIDRENVIVAGHTRALAAEELGLETVPVIVADDLTDEQIKAFRLADNKTAEMAGWDFEALGIELDEILDIDMSGFGFADIDEYIDGFFEEGIQEREVEDSDLVKVVVITAQERVDALKEFLAQGGYEFKVNR